MKHITYKFTDGSEITIDDKHHATISGHTKQFAYRLWTAARKDISMKTMWTALFIGIADGLHKKHGIVLEKTDHFTGKTVNHFENLMHKTQSSN